MSFFIAHVERFITKPNEMPTFRSQSKECGDWLSMARREDIVPIEVHPIKLCWVPCVFFHVFFVAVFKSWNSEVSWIWKHEGVVCFGYWISIVAVLERFFFHLNKKYSNMNTFFNTQVCWVLCVFYRSTSQISDDQLSSRQNDLSTWDHF